MTVALLFAGLLLPLASIGVDLLRDTQDLPPLGLRRAPEPESERVGRHRAELVGPPLPKRPAGKAALKREIQLAPLGPTPPLRIRKDHPDWVWSTDEHRMVFVSFFDGLPDDLAVMRVEVAV